MAFPPNTSINWKINGVNVPWSICNTLSLSALFFSCSFIMWYCCNNLLRQQRALRSKTLKSKKAYCPLSQTPHVLMSNLASFVVFENLLTLCPIRVLGVNLGLISMSLHYGICKLWITFLQSDFLECFVL